MSSTEEIQPGEVEFVKNASKWRTLLLLSLAELLGMSVWFSASAVVPVLTATWGLNDAGQAWLTMSVQVGFVVGALSSALLNLADRVPSRILFSASALIAAVSTAMIPLFARGIFITVILRFITGFALAGVYPVGMKIMTTWTKQDRGLAIGLLVGALTLGSASPHLLKAGLNNFRDWQQVLFLSALSALIGAAIAFLYVGEGPYRSSSPRFNWRYAGEILARRELVLANLGYLGHMWELYAMWAWVPVFLLASFELSRLSPVWASLASFAVIGIGGIGSLLAGRLADKYGRTSLTITSLILSGGSSITVGLLFGSNPLLLTAVLLVWGFTIVADSAQYSACISELCQVEYTGTALTLQTSLGFLLTLITIRLIPPLVAWISWRWAFTFLAIGPAVGIWAMVSLRRLPAAKRLAGGKR